MEFKQFLIKEKRVWFSQYFDIIDEGQDLAFTLKNKPFDIRRFSDAKQNTEQFQIEHKISFFNSKYQIKSNGKLITDVSHSSGFTKSSMTFSHHGTPIIVKIQGGNRDITFFDENLEIAKAHRKNSIWSSNDEYALAVNDEYDHALIACVIIIFDAIKDAAESSG